jgi:hypothetical protein
MHSQLWVTQRNILDVTATPLGISMSGMYVCVYESVCGCMYECMYEYMYECIYECMYECVYECVYECMYVC